MNIQETIDELTYMNYAANRTISPSVSAERWAKIYGPSTPMMEARYQQEILCISTGKAEHLMN